MLPQIQPPVVSALPRASEDPGDNSALINALQEVAAARQQPRVEEGVDPLSGGIDFAQSNLDMVIQRDGNGVVLPLDQQGLEKIKVSGLVPLILSVLPFESLPGLSQSPAL